jgi:hypothetical protein
VESAIQVGEDFWAHSAKLTQRGCTAFGAFGRGLPVTNMNFYYIFLLLLVVLSAYSESPQPPDPLDFSVVTVCPNSSSDSLGVLAPVLSQNEMSGSVLSQNGVLPQSEVFGSQNMILPQNEVYSTILPQSEVFRSQNMILRCIEPLSCLRVRCLDLRT